MNARLHLRLSEQEKTQLAAKAKEASLTVTDFIKVRCLRDEPFTQHPDSIIRQLDTEVDNLSAISDPKPPRAKKATLCERCTRIGGPSCPSCRKAFS